jgi:hypothetical protein
MKPHEDKAVNEVRTARKALCDRFDNDPRLLLEHFREKQCRYRGKIIKNWTELEPETVLRETPPSGHRNSKLR